MWQLHILENEVSVEFSSRKPRPKTLALPLPSYDNFLSDSQSLQASDLASVKQGCWNLSLEGP